MAGPSGEALTQDVIDEAVACRQAVARVHRELAAKGEWFFSPWNASEVTDPASGARHAFADAPADVLAREPSCWVLHHGERWHGFDDLPDGWCLLDPIKFAVVVPGMQDDGELAGNGIPGDLVTAYLIQHGIVPSRTTPHMVMFLFSMGVTKGKWGTLINTLLDFKRDYDANQPLAEVLPRVLAAAPARYAGLGLKDLGDAMWDAFSRSRMGHWEAQVYAQLPRPICTPRSAFQRLMAGAAELVPLDELAGRTAAVGVIPYPPGIPIVMAGENLGPADGPWINYLRVMQQWGEAFPGFAKELEGTIETDGVRRIYCLKP
jgi:arginine decarboxylase